ncbi:hypothetical protein HY628_02435 [Candidatus Uhrbacteria bacterium]|nr:hypothetical protein [Candidatus Uhrbacteria bacterium]
MPPAPPQLNPEGETLLIWKTPTYPAYKRGLLWFVAAGFLTVAVIIYAIASANYLFAIIILIFAIVIVLTALGTPELREIALTETGVRLGSRFFPYREIDRFAIVYQPPTVQNLYLEFKSGLRPRQSIHLRNQNPAAVREILLTHLKEDLERTDESLSEFFGRILKI